MQIPYLVWYTAESLGFQSSWHRVQAEYIAKTEMRIVKVCASTYTVKKHFMVILVASIIF